MKQAQPTFWPHQIDPHKLIAQAGAGRATQDHCKQANEAREQAAKSISPLDKEAWLRVAEERVKLAVSIEGRRE
jgi:hypothetical protein